MYTILNPKIKADYTIRQNDIKSIRLKVVPSVQAINQLATESPNLQFR